MDCHNPLVKRDQRQATAGRLAICALISALLVSCVSISPNPIGSLHPTAPPRPTAGQLSSPTAAPSFQPTSTASSAPTPVNTHEGATPPPASPGSTIDPELAAKIDAVVAQVPPIRGLEPTTNVPYELISREQFRQDLIALNDAAVPPAQRATEERFLKRMGLLPADADLNALLLALYGGQAAAFYRPDTGRFYVVQGDQPFGPADEITVAHEYTHALQDQHFDLEGTPVSDPSQGDAALGQLAVIEGDATLTMQQWANQNLSIQELIEAFAASLAQLNDPALANAPPILRRQLEFPYTDGFAFVSQLYELGGYDAINAALSTAVPASTEQILHPDKYLANEAPIDVTLPDATSALGEGWQVTYRQTLGELVMQVWAAGNDTAVDGWGGDRLNMYEGPDGAWIIVWVTAWDTQADADEFFARAFDVASPLAFGRPTIQSATKRVCLAFASDPALIVADRLPALGCP